MINKNAAIKKTVAASLCAVVDFYVLNDKCYNKSISKHISKKEDDMLYFKVKTKYGMEGYIDVKEEGKQIHTSIFNLYGNKQGLSFSYYGGAPEFFMDLIKHDYALKEIRVIPEEKRTETHFCPDPETWITMGNETRIPIMELFKDNDCVEKAIERIIAESCHGDVIIVLSDEQLMRITLPKEVGASQTMKRDLVLQFWSRLPLGDREEIFEKFPKMKILKNEN